MSTNDELEPADEQSAQLKETVIKRLTEAGNITKACKGVIGRTTYYDWCKHDPVFSQRANEALTLARESRIDQLEDAIMDQALGVKDAEGNWIQKPNPISQIFTLKALSRQSTNRVWSDAPPPEPKAIQDEAKPINTTSDQLKKLMDQYVTDITKAEQKAKSIDATTNTDTND